MRGDSFGTANGLNDCFTIRSVVEAYNRVPLLMEKRTLLPDGQGVLWHNANHPCEICCPLKNIRPPVGGVCRDEDLTTGDTTEGNERRPLRKNRVYILWLSSPEETGLNLPA